MRKSFLSASIALLVAGFSINAQATSLLDAYKDAVQNDPQILQAKARYDVARESQNIAFSGLMPKLEFSSDYTKSSREMIDKDHGIIDVDTDSVSYGIGFSQEIFNMGTWKELDASEKRALQAQAGYDLAQQALISRVSNAYFDILKKQDTLEFVIAEKKAIERQLEQTRQRFNVGLTAITDVDEAQANFDSAIAQEIRATNDIEIAKEALREITGKYYTDLDAINTDRFDAAKPSPENIESWVEKAKEFNLELKAKELEVQAAKLDIDRAESGHYPTLNLTGGLNKGHDDVTQLGVTNNGENLDSSSIKLSLTVPLYSGGATSAAVRQAQANYVVASEDMELTYRSAVRQVRSSYVDVIALVSTLKALQQSVVSAESALKATQAGFEVGTRTIVDVLNSTRNLYNAKSNLSNTRYDYILATLALKQASGSLNPSDVEAINKGLK